jgi:hypothetical protein
MATDQEIRELTRVATELVERIDALTNGTHSQMLNLAKTAKRNRSMIWILWVGFTLDIVLTIAVTLGFIAISGNQDDIQDVRTVERRDALCPLYEQFINADTPAARKRAEEAGQNMQDRDHAFKVIRDGYGALNCKEFDKKQ